MATAVGRGSSHTIKPMLRKASYHKKGNSPDIMSDAFKISGEEVKNKNIAGYHRDGGCWFPDHRTGIYYPKGQEKVMEGVPLGAGKDVGVNWFSQNEDFI